MIPVTSLTSTPATRLRRTAILAAITAALTLRAGAQDTTVEDSAWSRMDSRALNSLPAAFILRPTHFASVGKGGGGFVKAGGKMLGRALSLEMLLSLAYDLDACRIVLPVDSSAGAFDLLMTSADASKEKLQAEIAQRLGYTARAETRTLDVVLMKLKQGAPGLKPSLGNGGGRVYASSSSSAKSGLAAQSKRITIQGQPISNLIKTLQPSFDKPLLDRTGLTGNYDVTLEVSAGDGVAESDAIAQALPVQLGLELEPSREPISVLLVERAK